MEKITLKHDNAPDVRFEGEQIASAGSAATGETGRWSELTLYRTKGGKYVCHQIGRTQWHGERDRFTVKVCETESDIFDFFGHRWLAKELYKKAGLEAVIDIE